MIRTKLIGLSLRLSNSLSSTRQTGFQRLRSNQVTNFSSLTQSPPLFLIKKLNPFYVFPISHKKLHFSSKPKTSVELVLSSDWSDEIENELEELNPNLTPEFVVFVLRELGKNPQKCLQFFKWVRDKKMFELNYETYCLLLSSLCAKEFVDEFLAIASEIKEKGFYIHGYVYTSFKKVLKEEKLDKQAKEWTALYQSLKEDNVSKDVVEVILGSDWNEEVESKLSKLNVPLSKNIYNVIWKLNGEPLKALKFFEWVRREQKYEHNSLTYNAMARVLSLNQRFYDLWDLVTRMRSEGYEIDSFVKTAREFKRKDRVKLFEFVMDGPYIVSDQEFTWLMKTLVTTEDPDVDLINRVFNKYLEMGNTISKAIYDYKHKALCKVGRSDEAKETVDHMRNAGYKPDDVTCSQEVFGLCKLGRFEDTSHAINRMEAEGCAPNIQTWKVLIKGYCAAGEVDQAFSSFADMLKKKVEPDASLLNDLIVCFLSHDKLLGAYKFLVEMVNNAHVRPWYSTYILMIEKLMQDVKLEEALVLLSMMKQQGYAPHSKVVGEYISKSGTFEDAVMLLKASSRKGRAPSTAAYVNIISSFFDEGRHSEAKTLLDRSPQRVHKQKKIQDLFGLSQISSSN